MKGFKERLNQPLRLRWKWTIILTSVFALLVSLLMCLYSYYATNHFKDRYLEDYNQRYHLVADYLAQYSQLLDQAIPSHENAPVSRLDDSPDWLYFVELLEEEGVVLRVYNQKNQLLYASEQIQVPAISYSEDLQKVEEKDQSFFVGKQAITTADASPVATLEFIVKGTGLENFKQGHRQLMRRIWLVALVLVVIISVLLVAYFLKPLYYLINTLDMVEEESLSEIRVIKPKGHDEWSDLSMHINFLLDKIDRYVRNQKQFVEDVSHELRTPVAIVQGHLQMLNRWGKDDPEILDESIEASLQEINRMKELVQEMLDLSRAEHADEDYHDQITEVYSTVEQVYNNFVILYPEFDFYLDTDSQEELYVQMYRNHLEQLLIILLDNAVKYSTDRPEVHLAVSSSVNRVEIAVQDYGEGMSAEDKERVFSRFFRVDKARSREKGGNGLGLSIAWQLVNSYRGEIHVESVEDHGSIFYIELPILNDTRKIYQLKEKQKLKDIHF